MASQNKINLIKIKNHLQNKNFKIGGFLNFKSDASEKIFKLCKTANQSLLVPVSYTHLTLPTNC